MKQNSVALGRSWVPCIWIFFSEILQAKFVSGLRQRVLTKLYWTCQIEESQHQLIVLTLHTKNDACIHDTFALQQRKLNICSLLFGWNRFFVTTPGREKLRILLSSSFLSQNAWHHNFTVFLIHAYFMFLKWYQVFYLSIDSVKLAKSFFFG